MYFPRGVKYISILKHDTEMSPEAVSKRGACPRRGSPRGLVSPRPLRRRRDAHSPPASLLRRP